jgi:translocation and assembly module TamB
VRDTVDARTDTMRISPTDSVLSTHTGDEPTDIDLDVNINIPSGFWIRGKGLDLELSGDLAIKQQDGKPTLSGELRVIRGTVVVLGRTLELERGVVTFYGGDEINPTLDVVLGAEIEGTKIQILFDGTAQKPELKFASEPEMPEADILSVLLFGRPYEQLDDGQANLMKDRSREMLISVGAARLQTELGGQLGIDVVTVKNTGEDNTSTALSVGKYLKPQVLLSYAYALDKDSDSFISLEYFLKGQFKVETIFGNQGQTSLGIGWSKDY